MKKALALFLAVLLTGLVLQGCSSNSEQSTSDEQEQKMVLSEEEISQSFSGLDDPNLLQFTEDAVYSELSSELKSDDYIIDSITTSFVSKEYLEESAYNTKSNIFFGLTLDELDNQFQGTKYIFTLGEDGKTTVKEFTPYDETNEKIIKNVAVGTGVILICVVLTIATKGTAVAAVFAASAEKASVFALSSTAIGGITSGIVTGIETKDFDESVKAAALSGSEGFKWGAITGAVTGGFSKIVEMNKAIPSPRQSELNVLKKYGGKEQITYLNGNEVSYGTVGATRPDVIRTVKGGIEAIEVKNYNLKSEYSLSNLFNELKRQVKARVYNLPSGSTQRIVLDVTGRKYSKSFCDYIVSFLKKEIDPIYHNIPIDVVGAL